MSRRKNKPARRVQVPIEELNAIVERTRGALSTQEHATLEAAVDTLARLTEELETKTTTLERVRRLIFGPSSERTDTVLGKDSPARSPPPYTDPSGGGTETPATWIPWNYTATLARLAAEATDSTSD